MADAAAPVAKTSVFPLKRETRVLLESIAVVVAFVIMAAFNAVSSATSVFNGLTNRDISQANPTYITPDGGTFSIWGIIYLFEAILVVYQILPQFRNDEQIGNARKWIVAAFILNSMWLPIFAYALWWISLLVIASYLLCLWRAYQALQINYGAVRTQAFVPWHAKVCAFVGISLNMAWVTVATLLNFTVVSRNSRIIVTTLTGSGINATTAGYEAAEEAVVIGGNVDWALFCIVVASLLSVLRSYQSSDVPHAFVTAWALAGIYRMQKAQKDDYFPVAGQSVKIEGWCVVFIAVVAFAGAVALVRAVYQSFKAPKSIRSPTAGDLADALNV